MKRRKCGHACEVYSRVVGYYRPVDNWNDGKKEEFKDRVVYDVGDAKPKPLKEKGEEDGKS